VIYIIDLGKLKITIDTGAQQAKQELNDVGETAEKQQSKFSKFGEGLKKGALIGVGAATALGAGMVKVATDAADAAGNLDDMSQRTGMTAEAFQQYAYAAKLSGIETETLEKAMIKSQTAFADAKSGSETMGAAYQALGLNIEDIGTSSEAFDLVIQRLADMEDETQRNKIANDIFGKSYAELSPLLNEGAEGINALKQEAVDMGAVMSNEAVAAGAEFGDSLDKVKMATTGVFNEIGVMFLPILQKLLEWVTGHMPEIKKVIETVFKAIEVIVGIVGMAFEAILPILTALYEWIEPYFPVIQSIVETTFGAIGKAVQIVTDIFWGVVDAIKAAIEWLQSWNNTEAEDKEVKGSGNNRPYNGSHANGLDYVPFDGYIAELHKGERVLTAQEARNVNNSSNISITGNNFVIREEADIQKISRELQRQILTKQRGALA
jgi:hypothetical protein